MNLAAKGKATLKREQILDQYFPTWRDEVWKHSAQEPGFTPVPRTLSLITVLLKGLRDHKRDDPSMVYLDLWFRAFHGLVEVRQEAEFAHSCGFSASRGIRSWRERIAWLEKNGFIRTAKRWGDSISTIFLRHPDMVVRELEDKGSLPEAWKKEYEIKMKEIKAKRWDPPKKVEPEKKHKKNSTDPTSKS